MSVLALPPDGGKAWEQCNKAKSVPVVANLMKHSELLASFSGLWLQYAKMEGCKLSKTEENEATDKTPSHAELPTS